VAQKKVYIIVFIICTAISISTALVCLLNAKLVKRPIFQKTIELNAPRLAKYQSDGNIYIVDTGMFRLICMSPDGKIKWNITIDRLEQYIKFIDLAADENGNVYVCCKEFEYDAYLTKRDFIRKYDKNGNFVQDIFVMNYDENSEDRPHAFPQFGSLVFADGILSFARTMESKVILYQYDTYRGILGAETFYPGQDGYTVAHVVMKDFKNFAYTTRGGDIYEVVNGAEPTVRVSFNWTEDEGGVIPWFLYYDSAPNNNDIIFWDMVSGYLFRVSNNHLVTKALPSTLFDTLSAEGQAPGYVGFGMFENCYAGVFGDYAWFYDSDTFFTWPNSLILPIKERLSIIAVQVFFVMAILSFILAGYIFIVRICERYISLFIKQTVIIIPIVIIAFFILYRYTFDVMSQHLDTEIFSELSMVANVAVMGINGDDLEKLTSIKDYQSEIYKKLSATMKSIVADNKQTWGKSFYAGLMKGVRTWRWVCISDDEFNLFRASTMLDVGDEEISFYAKGNIDSGSAKSSEGLWAYANRAIFNSKGEMVGSLEIGMDMSGYEIRSAHQNKTVAIIATIICVGILLALIVVLAIIINQLIAVANVLQKISSGDYSTRIVYKGHDELGKVSNGLNRMAVELQKQIEHINRLNKSSIRFVPIQFMEQLGVPDITNLELGDNVEHRLTVLFFDIRSFSIHSEMMSTKENFTFINKVLGVAGPILRQHNGFVDKYLGDSAMALFTDALDAIRAGIEIYQKLILDVETRVTVGGDAINIGIGLHTGRVMMGIVGEKQRLSSTVVSKNVNLASRMESLTKQTKSGMLITRDTLSQMGDNETEFSSRFIGMVQVAGFNEVIGVFDMLDALPAATRKKRLATKKVFESGIRKYHTKDYPAAYRRFEAVVKADPSDACAQNYLEETRRRLADPSLPSVFVFDKK
jgi:class 3 adenylate cyclase/HAMP domain-containing protein